MLKLSKYYFRLIKFIPIFLTLFYPRNYYAFIVTNLQYFYIKTLIFMLSILNLKNNITNFFNRRIKLNEVGIINVLNLT